MQSMNGFNQSREFKLYDDVFLKDLNIQGYIDAVTNEKYRVRTNSGYEWVLIGDKNMIHANELQPGPKNENKVVNKNKTDLKYLG